jgi:hypothetical protein
VALGERARLALAWISGTQDQLDANATVPTNQLFRLNKNTFDVKFSGLGAGRGRLAFVLDLSHFSGDDVTTTTGVAPVVLEDNTGAAGTAIVEWPVTGGRYKVALQYGTGVASDFRSILTPQ